MKKLFCSIILGLSLISFSFAETIHVKLAYAMRKHSDSSIYVIRVELEDGFHDWYVCSTEEPWLFYGFESEDKIIVDRLIDIATIGY